ncbi:MarR family winged helix-turn-helix transcriptional regulator [Streptomyces sp. NBC_01465]|uniref:MarR family winged helix-turn-helix transcriptional regulator n=1 Tax=Streptomyces sp. NBC_01465 TaxID=2903878 RepID=UPI002E335CFA|nr:MarR family winged helix-turn-helix transcriptional regulator [Streptomyces sp. NBC_01465]
MEYSHSDAEIIKQPIGYWSWAAYNAVVTRTRGALAEIGLTQPQWWVLRQAAEGPKSRTEVARILKGYLDTGEDGIGAEIDSTVTQGWITQAPDAQQHLHLTPEGRALYEKAATLQGELQAERHAGISDNEYRATLKVLQRFIHNTGGRAWHH